MSPEKMLAHPWTTPSESRQEPVTQGNSSGDLVPQVPNVDLSPAEAFDRALSAYVKAVTALVLDDAGRVLAARTTGKALPDRIDAVTR